MTWLIYAIDLYVEAVDGFNSKAVSRTRLRGSLELPKLVDFFV